MGYYTRYSLELLNKNQEPLVTVNPSHNFAIINDLREYKPEEYCEPNLVLDSDGSSSGETAKWYDHEEDMAVFSARYPDVIFKLMGEGEEAGDLWVKYFLNGKMQICEAEIIYEPFDPKKLK